MKEKFKLTGLERSWILYDIGSSAFTLLVSTLIPICFNSLAGAAGVQLNIFGITLQNENLAVGSLVVLFIIGFLLFCKADKLNKERTAV